MRHRRRPSHSGMTLIELVVALVLASVLMAGLLQITTAVSSEAGRLRQQRTDYVAAGYLADRLREDLINARGMIAQPDSITLAGFASPGFIASIVRYEVRPVGRRRVLVRSSVDGVETCWVEFGQFSFESYEDTEDETVSQDVTGGLPAVPSRFRIGAVDANRRVLFDEVIRHHAN